jgi:hypothetical protein
MGRSRVCELWVASGFLLGQSVQMQHSRLKFQVQKEDDDASCRLEGDSYDLHDSMAFVGG